MRNDVAEFFARVDGDTGERDRLCRFHRRRDLVIRRPREVSGRLFRVDISTGAIQPPSRMFMAL